MPRPDHQARTTAATVRQLAERADKMLAAGKHAKARALAQAAAAEATKLAYLCAVLDDGAKR